MLVINPENAKYHIECDNCHRRAENNEYATISEAELWLLQSNWLCVWNFEKEHYCPECHHIGIEKNTPYRILGYHTIAKDESLK